MVVIFDVTEAHVENVDQNYPIASFPAQSSQFAQHYYA